MNVKRFVPAVIAVFVFIFFYEWVLHHKILGPTYQETMSLWRNPEEMKSFFWYIPAAQGFLALIFCYIFTRGYQNRGIAEGLRYGLMIGLLFIPGNVIMYAVQPLPLNLVIAWIVGGIIEGIVAGAIVAAIYRGKSIS